MKEAGDSALRDCFEKRDWEGGDSDFFVVYQYQETTRGLMNGVLYSSLGIMHNYFIAVQLYVNG